MLSFGDTIIVRDGTYYENLEVDKQLTIKSENGSANCIVDGGGCGDYEQIHADGDINCDDVVDLKDAIYLAKHVVGIPGYEKLYLCNLLWGWY